MAHSRLAKVMSAAARASRTWRRGRGRRRSRRRASASARSRPPRSRCPRSAPAPAGDGFLVWTDDDTATTLVYAGSQLRFARTRPYAEAFEALQDIRLAVTFGTPDRPAEAPPADVAGRCAAGPPESPVLEALRGFRAAAGASEPELLTLSRLVPGATVTPAAAARIPPLSPPSACSRGVTDAGALQSRAPALRRHAPGEPHGGFSRRARGRAVVRRRADRDPVFRRLEPDARVDREPQGRDSSLEEARQKAAASLARVDVARSPPTSRTRTRSR